jgi:glycosyltransferase involved in cell wall biosynthesis
LNEAETLSLVIEEAHHGILESGANGEVVVVDNGSEDQSVAIALREGARVVKAERRGYGAALDAGFRAARYGVAICGDADFSYPFWQIPELVEPVFLGQADLVLGSRHNSMAERGASPFLNRHFGTPLLSWLLRIKHGIPVYDCNSGMRALHASRYGELQMQSTGMEFASEMLIRCAKLKWRYTEVPIAFRKDGRSGSSHLNRWRDGMKHLQVIVNY